MAGPASRGEGQQPEFPLSDRSGAWWSFDFDEWARRSKFDYPEHAWLMLSRCESPAEAHLIRRLFQSPETVDSGPDAYLRDVKISVQVPCLGYRVDLVAKAERVHIAIEVDGSHHTATAAQIAADYRRERIIVRAGYIVLRFTGSEAINQPGQVWREVFGTIAVWERQSRSA